MSGTYSQIYIQVVFAVKGRENLISNRWKDELHKYIAGIIQAKGQKSIIVNGMGDHIHCFIGLKPSIAISDLVRDIKRSSSIMLKMEKGFEKFKGWDRIYCAFTISIEEKEISKTIHPNLSMKEDLLKLNSNGRKDMEYSHMQTPKLKVFSTIF